MSIAELIILEILLGGLLVCFITLLVIQIQIGRDLKRDQKKIEEQIKIETRWLRT